MLAVMEQECRIRDIVIDWDNSLMVGDRHEDENLAKNAKIAFMHIDEFLKLELT
jgi:histidinol phosphatase-like enzyme